MVLKCTAVSHTLSAHRGSSHCTGKNVSSTHQRMVLREIWTAALYTIFMLLVFGSELLTGRLHLVIITSSRSSGIVGVVILLVEVAVVVYVIYSCLITLKMSPFNILSVELNTIEGSETLTSNSSFTIRNSERFLTLWNIIRL